MNEETTQPEYVDRVRRCFICGDVIEHMSGEPEGQWRHVETKNHTAEPKAVES